MTDEIDLNRVRDEYHEFRARFDCMLLTTVSEHGIPDSSLAEFIRLEDDYYVYLSQFSVTARNLMHDRRVSLLLVEDAPDSVPEVSRKRVILKSVATRIQRRGDSLTLTVLDRLQKHCRHAAANLRGLAGYCLFKITPLSGSFVRGFADAYRLDGDRFEYKPNALRRLIDRRRTE